MHPAGGHPACDGVPHCTGGTSSTEIPVCKPCYSNRKPWKSDLLSETSATSTTLQTVYSRAMHLGYDSSAVLHNGRIYICGGYSKNNWLEDFWKFEFESVDSGRWSIIEGVGPSGRFELVAGLIKNKLYFAFGFFHPYGGEIYEFDSRISALCLEFLINNEELLEQKNCSSMETLMHEPALVYQILTAKPMV